MQQGLGYAYLPTPDRWRFIHTSGEEAVVAPAGPLRANNADALEYLRNRTNVHDPDERLRLAQWCVERGMQEQAIVEVKAAAELRPNHALTKHLLERLQQQPANQPPVAPAPQTDTPLEPATPYSPLERTITCASGIR